MSRPRGGVALAHALEITYGQTRRADTSSSAASLSINAFLRFARVPRKPDVFSHAVVTSRPKPENVDATFAQIKRRAINGTLDHTHLTSATHFKCGNFAQNYEIHTKIINLLVFCALKFGNKFVLSVFCECVFCIVR